LYRPAGVGAEGIRQGDRIAIDLPDELTDGAKVQPILKK
jgi:hypothetical protein